MSSAPVWFITGASSGFGFAMTKVALSNGHTVVAAARNAKRMKPLADLGADVLVFDVTAPFPKLQEAAATVIAKHGRVDYLISAAGYLVNGTIEETSPEEAFAIINTNVLGTINTVKAFLPALRTQPVAANGTRATVATFGSLGSWNGAASCGLYCMTKACTSSIGETLRQELAPFNIVATVIEPGYFRTSFLTEGAAVTTATRLDVYDEEGTTSAQMRRALQAVNGKQPGDVAKGSKVAFEVLTQTGVGEGKEVPVRIVIGGDADSFIRNKISSTLGILDDWKTVIHSTNHDDAT